nr:hypothetical protein [Tanacetum cinerariifolium]
KAALLSPKQKPGLNSYAVRNTCCFLTLEDSIMDPVTHKYNPPNYLRWQSAPASGHSQSKRTFESRAKRSSKIISLGQNSTLLASTHRVKSKTDIKSPMHYPRGIARTSE